MILVNFKIYKQSFGEGAVALAKICKEVARETGVEIIPVVSALDVYRIKSEVGGRVFVQSVDEYEQGARTGYISPIGAKMAGADGSLLNHSECRKKPGTIKKIVKHCPEKFVLVLCVHSLGQVERWAKRLKPDFVAYEPKYLIGSKDKSVASEKPDAIKEIVKIYAPVGVLAGAGIHQADDVKIACKMGAKGVLVASDVVGAKDPKKELLELAKAICV